MDDEEDYWNRSETKAFSFEDDDRAFLAGASGASAAAAAQRRDAKLIFDDNVSEISYELPSAAGGSGGCAGADAVEVVPLSALISDQDLQIVLDEQSPSDTQLIPKNCPPDAELRLLRRQLQDRFHPPPPAAVISKICANKPVSLECWRSLPDKHALLDAACATANSNAILTVSLHLVRTLKRPLWLEALRQRPAALRTYCHLLRQRSREELAQLYRELGLRQQLAMLQFGQAVHPDPVNLSDVSDRTTTKHPVDALLKLERLRAVGAEHFQLQSGCNRFHAQCVQNYVLLLEWQRDERSANALALDLLDSPVLRTIYYACTQHKWGSSGSSAGSSSASGAGRYNPQMLVAQHRVSGAQFEWVALTERARAHAWRDVEQLFERQSWTGQLMNRVTASTVFQCNVPLEPLLRRLHRLEAPVAVLNGFLARVADVRRRLMLARQMGCDRAVVDALVEQRDRAALERFVEGRAEGTEVRFYGEQALRTMRSKWNADLKLRKS